MTPETPNLHVSQKVSPKLIGKTRYCTLAPNFESPRGRSLYFVCSATLGCQYNTKIQKGLMVVEVCEHA